MISFWKHVTQRMTFVLSIWLLVTVLAACGGSGGTAANRPVSASPTSASALRTYTGTGFSMSYPSGWHKNASGDQVTFADPVGRNVLAVFADPDLMGAQSASTVADQAMSRFEGTLLANAQAITVPPTYAIAGVTWVQRSATGILAITDPGVQGSFFLLVANYPANAKNTTTYEVEYYGPAATFSQANVNFIAMLRSFSFMS